MKPLIKWAGGKTQLLKYIIKMLPKSYDRYYEPFIGGGAVLFALKPELATINDINTDLINMYLHIKKNPKGIMHYLKLLDKTHELSDDKKKYYYAIRDIYNNALGTNNLEQACRFIYLNKHCYNGLYRVNLKGIFNVPFNNKIRGNSFDEDNILEISNYLQNVNILNLDFEDAVTGANKGDFIFFDSPYDGLAPTTFKNYAKGSFTCKDHIRLANLFKELTKNGIYCMTTNHNTDFINNLYKGFNKKIVKASRSINSNGANRKGEEIILTNYDV